MLADVLASIASHLVSKTFGIEETIKKCRLEIQNYVDLGFMPSPNYFLLAANYFRKKRSFENETSICELYIELLHEFMEQDQPLNEKILLKIQKNISKFETRLYKIKYRQL